MQKDFATVDAKTHIVLRQCIIKSAWLMRNQCGRIRRLPGPLPFMHLAAPTNSVLRISLLCWTLAPASIQTSVGLSL